MPILVNFLARALTTPDLLVFPLMRVRRTVVISTRLKELLQGHHKSDLLS
jgi:hypothetical protein